MVMQTKFFKKTDAARIRKMEKQLLIKLLGAPCKELPSTKSHGVWLLWRTPTSCHFGGQITPFLRKHVPRCPTLLTCPLSPQPSSASTLWNCGETREFHSTDMYLKPSVFKEFCWHFWGSSSKSNMVSGANHRGNRTSVETKGINTPND